MPLRRYGLGREGARRWGYRKIAASKTLLISIGYAVNVIVLAPTNNFRRCPKTFKERRNIAVLGQGIVVVRSSNRCPFVASPLRGCIFLWGRQKKNC